MDIGQRIETNQVFINSLMDKENVVYQYNRAFIHKM